MSDGTKIEWTDATWNPVTGCWIVSPGCANCYAMKLAGTRLKHHPTRVGLTVDSKAGPVWNGEVRFNDKALLEPLRWRRPRMIFVCAHGDLFAEQVPDAWIDQVFAIMALCPQHSFQVLTKRPARMRAYLGDARFELRLNGIIWSTLGTKVGSKIHHGGNWRAKLPLPNVWLGTSVEDQKRADERIPELLATPAAVRFISAEPLLGPVDVRKFMWPVHARWPGQFNSPQAAISAGAEVTYHLQALVSAHARFLDWVIVGGESGVGARPMHPDWARSLRDQCAAAGVAYFFKQWGAWSPGENTTGPSAASERGAWRTDDGWHYRDVGRRESEAMHHDDAPDLWRLGRKAAGRLLDGVEHNAMPNATLLNANHTGRGRE